MAHCCPNCQKSAPLLFGNCPECGFDMKDCKNGCKHIPKTMGHKHLLETGECYCCGGDTKTCTCFTLEDEGKTT